MFFYMFADLADSKLELSDHSIQFQEKERADWKSKHIYQMKMQFIIYGSNAVF